jgi:bacterioferritin-associated ferredoxin
MIVCVCHRVSDRQIEREVRGGCTSFDELQADLRVGTACGACTDCARETFECHRREHRSEPLPAFNHGLRPVLAIHPG